MTPSDVGKGIVNPDNAADTNTTMGAANNAANSSLDDHHPSWTGSMTMEEIPLLITCDLLPLSSSSKTVNEGRITRYVASLSPSTNTSLHGEDGVVPSGAYRVDLTPTSTFSSSVDRNERPDAGEGIAHDPAEESYRLRGLASTHYSPFVNRWISTHGIPDEAGCLAVSVKPAGDHGDGGETMAEVDLSPLLESALFGSPVATACFVRRPLDGGALALCLHAVDAFGTVLKLALAPAHPSLAPPAASFVLPLVLPPRLAPHPGSVVESSRVCFPTETAVVFSLMPHLYCLDFGEGGTAAMGAVTRVWTDRHAVASDLLAGSDRAAGDGRSSSSLGGFLTRASHALRDMVLGGDEEEGMEYNDDDDDEDHVRSGKVAAADAHLPSIAALANLPCLSCDGATDTTARVASLHSDGSLRIWVAEPSRRERKRESRPLWGTDDDEKEEDGAGDDFDMGVDANVDDQVETEQDGNPHQKHGHRSQPQLRMPSVQRVVVATDSGWRNPAIPNPNTWEHGRDSIVFNGRCLGVRDDSARVGGKEHLEYELALYVAQRMRDRESVDGGAVHLIRGSIASPRHGGGGKDRLMKLTLPTDAQSVVDISWNVGRSENRSHDDLLVLFRRVHPSSRGDGDIDAGFDDDYDDGSFSSVQTTLAVYPLGVGRDASPPIPCIPVNSTLPFLELNQLTDFHKVSAEEELDRFFSPPEEDVEEDEGDIEKAEAKVDQAGLRVILQPMGRHRAPSLAVKRAMSRLKLVDAYSVRAVRPVDIVTAMRKWKKRDACGHSHAREPIAENAIIAREEDAGRMSSSSSFPYSTSIYHSFANIAATPVRGRSAEPTHREATPRVSDDEGEADSDTQICDVSTAKQAHRARWIKLLSEIRRQETALNEILKLIPTPMAMATVNVLVRGSTFSLLNLRESPMPNPLRTQEERVTAGLDELALELWEFVIGDPNHRDALTQMEALVYDAASRALPLMSRWVEKNSEVALVQQAGFLGSSALGSLRLDNDRIQLLNSINRLDIASTEAWLQAPFSLSSPVCKRLAIDVTKSQFPDTEDNSNELPGRDVRASVASLVASKLSSSYRLAVCRLLLIYGLGGVTASPIHHLALRSVMYSSALSWAIHQPAHDDPSFTVLDKNLSNLSNRYSGITSAQSLADAFIASSFKGNPIASLLTIISPANYGRVTLRLLAPFAEFPLQSSTRGVEETRSTNQNTKQITAECLLAEGATIGKYDDRGAAKTWDVASELLMDTSTLDSIDSGHFRDIFRSLKDEREQWWTFQYEHHHEEVLMRAICLILSSASNDGQILETRDEISRLCSLQTMKALFIPMTMAASDHGVPMDGKFADWLLNNVSIDDQVSIQSLYAFLKTMMRISNLIHRLTTLESALNLMSKDTTVWTRCCSLALNASLDVIATISSCLPPEMSREMPEVPTLWSIAFQTSMKGYLWDEALHACISNPLEERKKENLKQFVLGMIEVGAMGKLITMSLTVVGEEILPSFDPDILDDDLHAFESTNHTRESRSIDLFEMAASTIQEAAFENSALDCFGDNRPNYWGCLYALYASRGNWREAARAMYMCATVISSYVKTPLSDMSQLLSKEASEKIIRDITLSTQACAHALSLVEDPACRYLISGSQANATPTSIFNRDASDRGAIQVLTEDYFQWLAFHAITIQRLNMDDLSPDSITTIFKASSLELIDVLARLGYYDQAIAIAMERSALSEGRPGGIDLFDDALKHILRKYLVPAATNTCSHSECIDDGEVNSSPRPTISQIRQSSHTCIHVAHNSLQCVVSSNSTNPMSWQRSKHGDNSVRKSMAMDLVQQYTTIYANSCQGLANSVARAFLISSDGEFDLPIWLKNLCMFGTTGGVYSSSTGGLFAQHRVLRAGRTHNAADPAGLIRVFMQFGRLEDACDVVVSVLSSRNDQTSSNRLPEKGNIDYVPYDLIDALWNTIETVASSKVGPSDDIAILLKKRGRMENALKRHFESLKTSEEGLQSARVLSH
ncbi:hypothetical protein ACHAXS_008961 [Conticribra weissflogii]